MDVIYPKVRDSRSSIDMAVLLDYEINPEGKREILGAPASLSESEVHWREFFMDFHFRNTTGLWLIIGDDRLGMKNTRKALFPSSLGKGVNFTLRRMHRVMYLRNL